MILYFGINAIILALVILTLMLMFMRGKLAGKWGPFQKRDVVVVVLALVTAYLSHDFGIGSPLRDISPAYSGLSAALTVGIVAGLTRVNFIKNFINPEE